MPQQCILNQAVNMELNCNFKIIIFLQILQMKMDIKADRCLDWNYSVPINYETCEYYEFATSEVMVCHDLCLN